LSLVLTGRGALAGIPPAVCKTIFSEECWDEPKTVCKTVQKPVPALAFDEQCVTTYDQACNTVVDTVADFVPRQECVTHTEQDCTKVPRHTTTGAIRCSTSSAWTRWSRSASRLRSR
jgi:uncharacterized protein YgiB involved in biofilm formation